MTMDELHVIFVQALEEHEDLAQHKCERYALAAVMKQLADHLNEMDQDHAAGVLRAACGNWYFK